MTELSSSTTAFVLVPGGFCPSSLWEGVVGILSSQGYPVHAIDLPSVGERLEGPASMQDDAAHVRSKCSEYMSSGKNVVLVGNSYGGFVITEAAKGLDLPQSKSNQQQGKLIHLIYLASLLAPLGTTVSALLAGEIPVATSPPPSSSPSVPAGYLPPPPPSLSGPMIFSLLPPPQQSHHASLCLPMSAAAQIDPLTYAGYEAFPTTMVIPKLDKCVDPEWQRT